MRRFTTASIIILAGLVGVPACGSVLGVNTDRPIDDSVDAASGEATVDSGAQPTADSGVDAGSTVVVIPPGACDVGACSAVGGKCNGATSTCDRNCVGGAEKCATTVLCPTNNDCVIHCKGGECDDVTCVGGHSCTFDCTAAACKGAKCKSESCTFDCSGQNCVSGGEAVECLPGGKSCNLHCLPATKNDACDRGINCCAENGMSCPAASHCDNGGGRQR